VLSGEATNTNSTDIGKKTRITHAQYEFPVLSLRDFLMKEPTFPTCTSAKHAALRRNVNNRLARNQANVSE
jgi:hypothetical protein